MRKIKIRIPATTTNLGPGFDCLGLALTLYNTVELSVAEGKQRVEVRGEGQKELENADSNMVLRGIKKVYAKIGEPCPLLHLKLHNQIPVGHIPSEIRWVSRGYESVIQNASPFQVLCRL